MEHLIDDWMLGYFDGRDLTCPLPGNNRSAKYVHSFYVGRGEATGNVIPASVSRKRVAEIEYMEL